MSKFKMRKPPKEPVRENKRCYTSIYEEAKSIKDILDDLTECHGNSEISKDVLLDNLENIYIEASTTCEYYRDNSGYNIDIYFDYLETEEEFKQRQLQYKKDLEDYNKWYEENKTLIEMKEEIKKQKQFDKKNKKIEQLKKEKQSLEERIKIINDALGSSKL